MKELDFDELDKAVNSLMKSVPASESNSANPETDDEKVVTIASSSSSAVTTQSPSQSQLVPVKPSPAPRSTASSSRKPAGRFMDVVHPSSVMKPRVALSTGSREGVSITPRPDTTVEPPVRVDENKQESSATFGEANWPDPLDAKDNEPDTAAPVEDESTQSGTSQAEVPIAPSSVEPEPSIGSPFLANAKVEKRPLGSEPPTASPSEATTDSEDMSNNNETPSPDTEASSSFSNDQTIGLPAELQGDIVAVETNDLKQSHTDQPTPTPEPQTNESHRAKPTVSSSIAPQYKEQVSSGDQSHAAIYDTSSYAHPLAHPAKKKASWLWMVWVALLLLLGAGGAVVLYLVGII